MKATVINTPPIVVKVKEATNSDQWGPHGTTMQEIVVAANDPEEFNLIMETLWQRLDEVGENWRKCYKALTLLEFMCIRATPRVAAAVRQRSYKMKDLAQSFQYINPASGRDEGLNVRAKAQKLVELVLNDQRLEEERQKAAAASGRLGSGGISSSSMGGGSYDTPTTQPFQTSPAPAEASPPPPPTPPVADTNGSSGFGGKAMATTTTTTVGFDDAAFDAAFDEPAPPAAAAAQPSLFGEQVMAETEKPAAPAPAPVPAFAPPPSRGVAPVVRIGQPPSRYVAYGSLPSTCRIKRVASSI